MARHMLAMVLAASIIVSGTSGAYAASAYSLHLLRSQGAYSEIQPVRFISPDPTDPTVPSVGTNRYAYAQNDPINKSDQNGLCPICIGIAIGAAISYFSGTTEANTPETPDDVSQTSETMAMANMALGATMAGPARSLAVSMVTNAERASLSFAQKTYSETFSAIGRDKYSALSKSTIRTIDDLSSAIKSGKVDPSKLTVDVGKINGKGYIVNTRTATALERAGVPRSKWSINDITKIDKDAMDRLAAQLERNNISPGEKVSNPSSSSSQSGGNASTGTKSTGGGLLGAIGRATGLW
ncbi:hypothetical protein FJ958_30945 [Mesorhizobium sp. B2-3-5]|nr:hypothetical protein FJ958_30945 [Mesorhizobium sp. B2-3-5]